MMAEPVTLSSNTNQDTSEEEKFEDAADGRESANATPVADASRSDSFRGVGSRDETPTQNDHARTLSTSRETLTNRGEQGASNRLSGNSDNSTSSEKSTVVVEDVDAQSVKSRTASIDQKAVSEKTAPPKPPPRPSRFQGFSASLPSVPWGAPPPRPTPNVRDPSPQAAPQTTTSRKITAPFGWLSRATSAPKDVKSPDLKPATAGVRRNTAVSVLTVGSNSDLMVKSLDQNSDGVNGSRPRQSLRDQFKALRLRQEVGISADDPTKSGDGTPVGYAPNGQAPLASPTGLGEGMVNIPLPHVPQSPLNDPTATINPNLPPGTVSGISAAPSDASMPIDWDFWQQVVNEGPQTVAKSSPEELTAAISGGIPQTIRGVIWQLLAGSKNDELEGIYHDLKTRGTKDEIRESAPSISTSSVPPEVKEDQSIDSSRSSVHSDGSTPATSTNNETLSPTRSHEISDHANDNTATARRPSDSRRPSKADVASLVKLEKMIKRDMGSRTSYSKYAVAAGFQEGLFNVCKAYALYDDAVGYPQGMNFIIMPLLFIMSEEEAFCVLVRMMNKYQMRELFINDMPGLHLHLYQFERLLEDLEPALYCHLNRRGVTPKLYATQWFLTMFAYRFPLQLVMRVFDLVLCEGLEGAILKFGMALMQRNVQILLAMNDMQALTNHLKEKLFDVYIDAAPSSKSILESGFFGSSGGTDTEVYRADLLVQDACAVKLTPEMLASYTTEWEEKTRAEKAKETELENLRTDSVTKAAQIKSLEKRAEKSDTEHIEIANELVKLKVENQDLMDENESLKGQVEELRKVAASEAANVEERMRAGTEQVMQRNIEVQNANRHMEDQMAEMERELVEMKMKYAELNGEHETLKQRWTDLRKALE